MSRAGQPIEAAYEGALDFECAMCGAAAGDWCRDEFGKSRRVPCVKRPRVAVPVAATDENGPVLVSRMPGAVPEPAQGNTDGFLNSGCAPIDFSEPRRSMQEAEWS